MDLWSYLLKPVQRISKYSLLLQDMMRECGPGQTREMAEVKAALEVVHFQLRHGNNLLAMDAIQLCDVRHFVPFLPLKKKHEMFSVFIIKESYLWYIYIVQEYTAYISVVLTDKMTCSCHIHH